jgi:hypothetical protein
MSTDTGQKYKDLLGATFAPDGNAAALAVVQGSPALKVAYHAQAILDASINTTANIYLTSVTPVRYRVTKFYVTMNTALTETNTNLAQIQLCYNNSNGGADTNVALVYTNVAGGIGNVTINQPASITLTAANVVVPSGSSLLIRETKAGAGGLALPARTYDVFVEPV